MTTLTIHKRNVTHKTIFYPAQIQFFTVLSIPPDYSLRIWHPRQMRVRVPEILMETFSICPDLDTRF